MNAVKHSGGWGVPARPSAPLCCAQDVAVALSARTPRSFLAAGYPLQSLTRDFVVTCAFMFAAIGPVDVSAQGEELHAVQINEAYTWRTSSQAILDSVYLDLAPVSSSSHRTLIRISFPGRIIDLVSDDDSTFSGTLTLETTEYRYFKAEWGEESRPFQRLYRKEPIETAASTVLARDLLQSGQDTLLTDSLITGWAQRILDCWSMLYWFKIGERRIEQSFYCAHGQNDSLPEKRILLSNYERVTQAVHLKERYEAFTSSLPGGTYSRDGFIMMTKPKTKRNKSKAPRAGTP